MTFEEASQLALKFRDDRDWAQFHNPKDLAISITLEAAELLENFQWSGSDLACDSRRDQIEEELADVLVYCVHLADAMGIDPVEAMAKKMRKNAEKYPVEKARGTSRKYTELN